MSFVVEYLANYLPSWLTFLSLVNGMAKYLDISTCCTVISFCQSVAILMSTLDIFWRYSHTLFELHNKKTCYAVTAQLISPFVFATYRVQSLYFLNQKFEAYSHFLCRTWSETWKTGFLAMRLISFVSFSRTRWSS